MAPSPIQSNCSPSSVIKKNLVTILTVTYVVSGAINSGGFWNFIELADSTT
jgi:hypothetical protein